MIYNHVINESKNVNFEDVIQSPLELMQEYYENELSFLNMAIEYKDTLGTVNESYTTAIHEGYMENIKKKASNIIKKVIEYIKKIGEFIKTKVQEIIKNAKNKAKKISNNKPSENKGTIEINLIDYNKYFEDVNDRHHSTEILDLLDKVRKDDSKYTFDDVTDKLEKFDEEELDIKDYFILYKITNENKRDIISMIDRELNSYEKLITISLKTLRGCEETFNKILRNYEYMKIGQSPENIKEINEQLKMINLIIVKFKTNDNLYINHLSKYINYTSKVIDKLVNKFEYDTFEYDTFKYDTFEYDK